MVDLLLVLSLGFLGSFGHCVGMCGPLTAAFSLAQSHKTPSRWQQLAFHGLLNLGRLLSYLLVGAGIGAAGSVLLAGGQMAGIGSLLRRGVTLFTGGLLVWVGLLQVSPGLLPRLPLLHPMLKDNLHQRLGNAMMQLSKRSHWSTPLFIGGAWGLIPCGFLYAAQLKAAETGSPLAGCLTLLAFGLGTLPTMLGIGVTTALMSADRRSQLFRMGGWITLIIGILTLLRTGDTMTDYTGHAALLCLMLALVARPLSRFWAGLLQFRRGLGVGAFVLAVAHTLHMIVNTWNWNMQAVFFMLPQHQWGIALGAIALALMLPLALTSFDWAQRWLGQYWRSLHLLALPALVLGAAHALLIGSSYLGKLQLAWYNWVLASLLVLGVLGVLLVRSPNFWKQISYEKLYVPPKEK